ncbi:hypothetical protein [Owenweeksia hongkongensis]|uniref:hypothetical protein n=1 Tax=Owenweeksia hongkongensis TaxID=253245 RepID=UPI003A8EED4D
MKTVKVEILDEEAIKALLKLEKDGLIKLVNNKDYDSKSEESKRIGENRSLYNVTDQQNESVDKDLDKELAKYGFTMQEIVDEVKAVRKEKG